MGTELAAKFNLKKMSELFIINMMEDSGLPNTWQSAFSSPLLISAKYLLFLPSSLYIASKEPAI